VRRRIVAVIGAGECDARTAELAREVGRRLAESGCAVLTGGLGGVMQAASRGANEAGGLVIGVLPGGLPEEANPWVDVAIATGMGDARNVVIASTAEAFVAVSGAWGTLSEIAFALRRGKPVVSLGSWAEGLPVRVAGSAEEAVRLVV
jgi:uncharacterized protein (TIGR00725 family)